MLILFIWLSTVSQLPQYHIKQIQRCQSYKQNYCVLLQDVHWQIYSKKYESLLNFTLSRKRSLSMVQRADILRLLYLYEKGGVYTDLDNKINYTCLYQFIKLNNETFYFADNSKYGTQQPITLNNHFFYVAYPFHQKLKKSIQSISKCQQCPGMYLAGPFLHIRNNQKFFINQCIIHKNQGSWVKQFEAKQQLKCEIQKMQYGMIFFAVLVQIIVIIYYWSRIRQRKKQQAIKYQKQQCLETYIKS